MKKTIILPLILAFAFTSIAAADPNLVGWWKFDEGSGTDANDSAGTNHGTLVGEPNWVAGKIGNWALDFNGVDDYVEISDDSSLNIQGEFTLSAWVKTPHELSPGDQDYHNIIAKDSIYVSGYGLEIYERSSSMEARLELWSRGTSLETVYYDVTSLWQANTWYHVAGVYNGTDLMIYFNGELKNTDTGIAPGDTTGDSLYIGSSSDADPTEEPWNGTIDDVRIYDKALSDEEIQQLYQEGMGHKAFAPNPADGQTAVDPNGVLSWSAGKDALSHDVYFGTNYNDVNDANEFSDEYKGQQDANSYDPCGLDIDTIYYWRIDEVNDSNTYKGDVWRFKTWFEPNLIGWWKFDGDANDSVGSNHGTFVGDANIITDANRGLVLNLDGNSDYVEVADSPSLRFTDDSNVSVACWAKLENDEGWIIHNRDLSGTNFWQVELRADGTIWSQWKTGSPSNTARSSSDLTSVVEWHHIAVVYKGLQKETSIYVDGVIEGSDENSQISGNLYQTNILKIGGYNLEWVDGLIDDVRIYDRALNAGEVETIFRNGLSAPFISLSPKEFLFEPEFGGANPPDQMLTIRNMGPNTLNWTISEDCNWLGVDPNSGSATGEVNEATLSVDISGLSAGSHNCELTISDPCAENNPQTVNVDLVVHGSEIGLSSTSFIFYANEGGPNPDNQILGISNSGTGTLNWEIDCDCNWLSADPNAGSSTGEVNDVVLAVDIAGLTMGPYDCNLTVSDSNAENSPQTATVTLAFFRDITVDDDGPADFDNIQAAINDANNGDTVIVADGTYTGSGNRDIDFLGKAITVQSENGPNTCIIDCEGTHNNPRRAFYFENGEGADSVLEGFTIKNGYLSDLSAWGPSRGGAIYCNGSSPTIDDCVITNNIAYGRDGDDMPSLSASSAWGGGI